MNRQRGQPPTLDEHGEDVTRANPFGLVVRGCAFVERTIDRAAANYAGGRVHSFEEVSPYETPELACERAPESVIARP